MNRTLLRSMTFLVFFCFGNALLVEGMLENALLENQMENGKEEKINMKNTINAHNMENAQEQ